MFCSRCSTSLCSYISSLNIFVWSTIAPSSWRWNPRIQAIDHKYTRFLSWSLGKLVCSRPDLLKICRCKGKNNTQQQVYLVSCLSVQEHETLIHFSMKRCCQKSRAGQIKFLFGSFHVMRFPFQWLKFTLNIAFYQLKLDSTAMKA